MSQRQIQLMLVENFVKMQQVLTNLSVKFDLLSDNITQLLQLIELSAKTFIEKQQLEKDALTQTDRDLLEKLDSLANQNKTIAKGLTLVEEKLRHKLYGEPLLNAPTSGPIVHHPVRRPANNQEPAGEREEIEKQKPRPLPRL